MQFNFDTAKSLKAIQDYNTYSEKPVSDKVYLRIVKERDGKTYLQAIKRSELKFPEKLSMILEQRYKLRRIVEMLNNPDFQKAIIQPQTKSEQDFKLLCDTLNQKVKKHNKSIGCFLRLKEKINPELSLITSANSTSKQVIEPTAHEKNVHQTPVATQQKAATFENNSPPSSPTTDRRYEAQEASSKSEMSEQEEVYDNQEEFSSDDSNFEDKSVTDTDTEINPNDALDDLEEILHKTQSNSIAHSPTDTSKMKLTQSEQLNILLQSLDEELDSISTSIQTLRETYGYLSEGQINSTVINAINSLKKLKYTIENTHLLTQTQIEDYHNRIILRYHMLEDIFNEDTNDIKAFGIQNPFGQNLCYINSTVQSLFHTPNFVSFIKEHIEHKDDTDASITQSLHNLFEALEKGTVNKDDIQAFRQLCFNCGWRYGANDVITTQQDAEEFLTFILDQVNFPKITTTEEMVTTRARTKKDVHTVYKLHIEQCKNDVSIQDLLSNNPTETDYGVHNFETLLKQNADQALPQILPLQLTRWSTSTVEGQYIATKNSKRIHPSLEIQIPYEKEGEYELSLGQPEYNRKVATYELAAVTLHYGGTGGGHYVCCAPSATHDGQWLLFNDSKVRSYSFNILEEDIAKNGYVYYYKLKTSE